MESKTLCVKRLLWKRIAKNQMRFGWNLQDAEQETETTSETRYDATVYGDTVHVTPHTTTHTKVRIWLYFWRDIYVPISVKILELFYNLFFWIRRILGTVLPVAWGITLVLMLIFPDIVTDDNTLLGIMSGATGGWLILILLEGILARVAQHILRKSA